VILSALFATLSSEKSSLVNSQRFLTAYIIGVEVMARLGKAVNPAHYLKGWHSTATLGATAETFGNTPPRQSVAGDKMDFAGLENLPQKQSQMAGNVPRLSFHLHIGTAAGEGSIPSVSIRWYIVITAKQYKL